MLKTQPTFLKLTAKRPCRYGKNAHQFSHIAPPALAALNFLSVICLGQTGRTGPLSKPCKAESYKVCIRRRRTLHDTAFIFYGISCVFSIVFAVFRKKSKILPRSWTRVVYLDVCSFAALVLLYILYITAPSEMQTILSAHSIGSILGFVQKTPVFSACLISSLFSKKGRSKDRPPRDPLIGSLAAQLSTGQLSLSS